ncbi:BolA family protein [Methylophaga sp.]|uniref:BolA family protein n=1 Tax=Methylophaga sp. TaxID=2024840 RepID=UPI0027228B25|nr:BolA/IbaG family iron-sulfur metabolism protein [Methylophaga sp.]MDO8828074.1 BolA/IbaG family iron-sulfur metabolism protein [Methylophaga sp.]
MAAEGLLLPALQEAVADSDDREIISVGEIERLIKADYDDATVYINGEGCYLEVTVVSSLFEGLTMVKQQQGVMAALEAPLSSGRLHAVTVKTYTPEKWQEIQGANADQNGLLQIQ